jgi:hypothetical protein
MKISAISLLLKASLIAFQPGTVSAQSSSHTPTTSSNGTTSASPSAFASSIVITVNDLWDLFVGPVKVAAINTTVAATPVPTSELIPPPYLNYESSMPSGRQVPVMAKNQSWSFPKGFWWGVASAAYQVEGAVKDEGRGPSIWDAEMHRVTNFAYNNDTGDVADNQYYLYKQGRPPIVSRRKRELTLQILRVLLLWV